MVEIIFNKNISLIGMVWSTAGKILTADATLCPSENLDSSFKVDTLTFQSTIGDPSISESESVSAAVLSEQSHVESYFFFCLYSQRPTQLIYY